jgi:hypothetical protein
LGRVTKKNNASREVKKTEHTYKKHIYVHKTLKTHNSHKYNILHEKARVIFNYNAFPNETNRTGAELKSDPRRKIHFRPSSS